MAKVLACPNCGHKHPLELLVGLDTFVCQECGRTLAVPLEVSQLQTQQPSQTEPPEPQLEPDPKQEPVAVSIDGSAIAPLEEPIAQSDEPIRVVARSSLNIEAPVATAPAVVTVQPERQTVTNEPANEPVSEPAKKPVSEPAAARGGKSHTKIPSLPVPFLGQVLSWILALPVGFFIVVLLPRFFGFGFHASDFVDVITTSGLGRYKIVVALIVLWSIATVACVSLFNGAVRRLLRLRKIAV
jgi:hypothetical protein